MTRSEDGDGGRFEDLRLTTGRGSFTADLSRPGLLHARFVRAEIARGTLRSLDLSAARAAPGVAAIFTAADLDRDGISDLTTEIDPPREDGGKGFRTARAFLVRDRIRFVGEPVALVVAESAAAAEDAAGLVVAETEDAEPVLTRAAALAPGAGRVWPEMSDNIAFVRHIGDAAKVREAIDRAAHVSRIDLDVTRVAAAPLEPRAALGECGADGRLVLTTSTQGPFALRNNLAEIFGVDRSQVRVIAPDVGGSFGMKGGVYREDVLVLWAARRLGRPVRWVSDRSEAFLADDHGRDVHISAELGLDESHAFTALAVRCSVNVGAYLARRSFFMVNNIGGIAGVYRTPAIFAEIMGFHTNTGQTAPYRGAGRPEATYVIERLIDQAARELGLHSVDLRRRNLIAPEEMPFQTGLLFKYDCGNFPATMDRASRLAALEGFAERRRRSEARGRLRGFGIANPIEIAAGPIRGPRKDTAIITVAPDGEIELRTGAVSSGQGIETALPRIAAELLGVSAGSIRYRQADTELMEDGRGAGGSAALAVSGAAVAATAKTLIEKGRSVAADALEAAVADIEFADGVFSVAGTDRTISLAEVAARSDAAGGISARDEFKPEAVTFPNGCHIAEVEIDPETGSVELVSYTGVEDIGAVLNPVLVDGQLHGGIAQGAGQAMAEAIRYDPQSGQLLTASFLDYRMPRAEDMPEFRLDSLPVPTAVNPLGVKGVGEAGTVGSLAVIMNAVNDALVSAGAEPIDMPASPDRVWAALAAAGKRR
jgi:carbon-monoxide dehydrogenase large subunit